MGPIQSELDAMSHAAYLYSGTARELRGIGSMSFHNCFIFDWMSLINEKKFHPFVQRWVADVFGFTNFYHTSN